MVWKIYKVEQDVVNGYDTYDSMIVVARNATEAKSIHPDGETMAHHKKHDFFNGSSWPASAKDCRARQIGVATGYTEVTVVLASFNAG